MRTFGQVLQAFAKIGEKLCLIFMVGIFLIPITPFAMLMTGYLQETEVEIMEVVKNETSFENPANSYGPNYYIVKYKAGDGYINVREPIKAYELYEVGDTYQIYINSRTGEKSLDGGLISGVMGAIITVLILALVQYLLVLFRKSIDILLIEGKSGLLHSLSRLVLGSASQIVMLIGLFFLVSFCAEVPNYFNNKYDWVKTYPVSYEQVSYNKNNEAVYKFTMRQEIKGKWIEFEDTFVPYKDGEIDDPIRYLMNTENGEFVDGISDCFDYFFTNGIIFIVVGYILSLCSKLRFKRFRRKVKQATIADCLAMNQEETFTIFTEETNVVNLADGESNEKTIVDGDIKKDE